MPHFLSKKKSLHTLCLTVTLAILAYTPAVAQESEIRVEIENCKIQADPTRRLACFDQLFGDMKINADSILNPSIPSEPSVTRPDISKAVATQNPLTVPNSIPSNSSRPEVNENKLTQSVTSFKAAKKEAKLQDAVKSVSSEIARTKSFGYNKLRFYLKNGQVWEQVVAGRIKEPKISASKPVFAEIKKGALGSFSLQVDGKGRAVKVKRVR